jgi:hypothetical protein
MIPLPVAEPPVPVVWLKRREITVCPAEMIALWITEGGSTGTLSPNTNGTVDHGPFQINTVWAQKLEREFVSPQMITTNFCCSLTPLHTFCATRSTRRMEAFGMGLGITTPGLRSTNTRTSSVFITIRSSSRRAHG